MDGQSVEGWAKIKEEEEEEGREKRRARGMSLLWQAKTAAV